MQHDRVSFRVLILFPCKRDIEVCAVVPIAACDHLSYRFCRNAFLFPVGDSWDETKRNFAEFHTSEMFRGVCARCTLRGRNPKPPIDSPLIPTPCLVSSAVVITDGIAKPGARGGFFLEPTSNFYSMLFRAVRRNCLEMFEYPANKIWFHFNETNKIPKNLIRLLSLILCTNFFDQIYRTNCNQL